MRTKPIAVALELAIATALQAQRVSGLENKLNGFVEAELVHEAKLDAAMQRVEELERNRTALAEAVMMWQRKEQAQADLRIKAEAERDALSAQVGRLREALKDLLEQIDSLEGMQLTRDIEPYKAEANWNDVYSRARTALAQGEDNDAVS